MVDGPDGGWFAYSPLSEEGNDHLTPEQREIVRQHDQRLGAASEPIGDVRVLIHELAPGQVEVRYVGPTGVSSAELLRFVISELTTVLEMHERDSD